MANKSNRRGFFSKALKSVLAVGIGASGLEANAQPVGKKVKLLTADGKLIEMDQEILDQKAIKQKSTNQDVLNWSDQTKT